MADQLQTARHHTDNSRECSCTFTTLINQRSVINFWVITADNATDTDFLYIPSALSKQDERVLSPLAKLNFRVNGTTEIGANILWLRKLMRKLRR